MPPAPTTFVQLCRANNIAAVPANQRLQFLRDAATLASEGLSAKSLTERCAALSWARDSLQNSTDPDTWPTLLTPALYAYLQGLYTVPPYKGAPPTPSNERRLADIITLFTPADGAANAANAQQQQPPPDGINRFPPSSSATTSASRPLSPTSTAPALSSANTPPAATGLSNARCATGHSAAPAPAGRPRATACPPHGTATTSPPPARRNGSISRAAFPARGRQPARTPSSDYLRLPVLTRPAETRQHDQFYLLPPPRPRGGPPAPLPHPCPLWLTRPAETRQPPYLPSPPPPPPSCLRTPLARREYGPPWRSSAPRLAQQSLLGCAWLRARSLPRHASSLELASFSHGAPLALPLAPPRSRALHYILGSARCWHTATLSSARTGTGHLLSASSCTPASRSWSLLLPGGRHPSPPSRLTRSVSLGPRRPDLSLRPCAPFSTPCA